MYHKLGTKKEDYKTHLSSHMSTTKIAHINMYIHQEDLPQWGI